jgi:hypothetical protein
MNFGNRSLVSETCKRVKAAWDDKVPKSTNLGNRSLDVESSKILKEAREDKAVEGRHVKFRQQHPHNFSPLGNRLS